MVRCDFEPEQLAAPPEELIGEGVAAPVVGADPDDEQATAVRGLGVRGGLREGGRAVEEGRGLVEGRRDVRIGVPHTDPQPPLLHGTDTHFGRAGGVAVGIGDHLAGHEGRGVTELTHLMPGEHRTERSPGDGHGTGVVGQAERVRPGGSRCFGCGGGHEVSGLCEELCGVRTHTVGLAMAYIPFWRRNKGQVALCG
ncbi:hypothetical protein SMALB_6302 [Streptomyces malaysiensis]|uniref:Uncharacterized protein n=1 Tax=Streptomyces malaysiensis TaxID=92644 RepID=A0A7X5X7V2_STRMQ|nr:hypothetical protein [Streptomyces malaysiensis]